MRVLVTGAGGQLGRDVVAALSGRRARRRPRGATGHRATRGPAAGRRGGGRPRRSRRGRPDGRHGSGRSSVRPDVVIHAAAWTAVDACEADPDRAFAVNALGTRHVAEAARRHGAHLVYISTDYVFDGHLGPALSSSGTPPIPLSVYGRSKLGGEQELDPGATIVRTSWVCGAHGDNMVGTVLRLAAGAGAAAFRRRPARAARRSPPTSPGPSGRPRHRAAPRCLPRDQPGRGLVVRVRRRRPRRRRPRPGAGRAHHAPPSSIRPAPLPARPTRSSTTPRSGSSGMALLPDWHDALARLVPALVAPGIR